MLMHMTYEQTMQRWDHHLFRVRVSVQPWITRKRVRVSTAKPLTPTRTARQHVLMCHSAYIIEISVYKCIQMFHLFSHLYISLCLSLLNCISFHCDPLASRFHRCPVAKQRQFDPRQVDDQGHKIGTLIPSPYYSGCRVFRSCTVSLEFLEFLLIVSVVYN